MLAVTFLDNWMTQSVGDVNFTVVNLFLCFSVWLMLSSDYGLSNCWIILFYVFLFCTE